MLRIFRILAPLTLLVSLLAATPARATNIAFVDLQRALLEVSEGKAAKAKLKKEFDKRQSELDGKQEELMRLKQELEKQSSVMDPTKRQAKETELQQKFMALQQIYVTLQGELSKQEKGLTDKIFAKMEVILQEIAKAAEIDMVLERNQGVVFANASLDLTGELIRKYNARFGKAAKSTAPKKGK